MVPITPYKAFVMDNKVLILQFTPALLLTGCVPLDNLISSPRLSLLVCKPGRE